MEARSILSNQIARLAELEVKRVEIMLLPLQKSIIYGPIQSRRLGSSLGINVLPIERKVCTLNCLYCQYGWTLPDRQQVIFPEVDQVAAELEKALRKFHKPLDYITFSGNGEPTLHPDFPEIVQIVIQLRDRLMPETRTAILSNSTRVNYPEIRNAIEQLDLRIMKLDAGNEKVFSEYNGALPGVHFSRIIRGLELLQDVTIQALFTGGPRGNYQNENLRDWIDVLFQIKPLSVQVYSLDRASPSRDIQRLNHVDLQQVVQLLESRYINVWTFPRKSY
jgi:wyosine [tRNA(Phe)-imidazoG37] synthetase (radical SAM superfamily)